MADKYDDAIAFLTEHPEQIDGWNGAWGNPDIHPAGCLFQFVTPTGSDTHPDCGCLTLIRHGDDSVALDDEGEPDEALTARIRADERIPAEVEDITVESLPVFAEWQRRLDKELHRGA